jgi:hypothetical protein
VARKFEKPSGRISLRLTPEMHLWLGETAATLGLDVNKLIVDMIRDAAPTYDKLAREIEKTKSRLLSDFAKKRAEDAIQQADKLVHPPGPDTDTLTGFDLLVRLREACTASNAAEWPNKMRVTLSLVEPTLDPSTAERLIDAAFGLFHSLFEVAWAPPQDSETSQQVRKWSPEERS